MDRILQSDIDILVLRHLAAYSCTETARSLVKEKPELRTYIQMQGPIKNQRLMGGCTPATDSIQTLRSSTLIHSSLKDIICEYANAKAIVKELTDNIVFEWDALKYDEINSQDSIMTQLRAISKLVKKLCKAKPELFNKTTCTTEDGVLPLFNDIGNKITVDVEVQTEIEEEAVQLMFYNNLLSNTNFQEKIADSINEQLAKPQNTRNEEVVVKNVSSKTESEIDTFLREMLSEEAECVTGSSSPINSIEMKEQDYVDVEQNFISMFNDAQSIIESSQGTIQANVVQLRSAQKHQIDLVEMLTTPKKPEVAPQTNIPQQNARNPPESSVAISERFLAPCGKTYSVVTKKNSYPLNEWGRLGRRPIEPKTNVSTNKRKAKFATPVKLTPVKAHTSSVNYLRPPEINKQLNVPIQGNKQSSEESQSPEIEIVDTVVVQKPLSTPNSQFLKPILAKKSAPPLIPPSPKPVVMPPVSISNSQTLKPVSNSNQPSSSKPVAIQPSSAAPVYAKKSVLPPEHNVAILKTIPISGPLVRPVNPSGYRPFSPIKIVRNDYKSMPQPMRFIPTGISSASQLPITIFSPPAAPTPRAQNSLNAIYSPITPVAADSEHRSHSDTEIRMLSECKITPNQPQAPLSTPNHNTPAISKSSSTMSPFLRKLVTSAQKAKTALVVDVEKPNKKSYSTPRKKNHVRNLQFKTPPSLGKVNTENLGTSSDTVNPLKRKGDELILPKSKKRLEWVDSQIETPVVIIPTVAPSPTPTVSTVPVPQTKESTIERLNKREGEHDKSKLVPPAVKKVELRTPKLIIKNKNTVISVTPPEAEAEASQSSSHKEKSRHMKMKHLFSPPTPPKKKRGRKSKNAIDAQAAQAEACNALPLGKRGRGRTPRKKPAPRSPLRTILPKPPPQTLESPPPETPVLKLPSTIPSSTPVVLVLPQAQVPPSTSNSSVQTFKPLSNTTNANSSNYSVEMKVNSSVPKTASSSMSSSFDTFKSSLPITTISNSISINTVKPAFVKSNSSSSLHTPLNTPLKTHISPEIPPTPTPRLFLTSTNTTDPADDLLKLNYESTLNISKFFATPLKSGNPITPGKIDNPILVDESSTGSIFDTPDKDPNAKPLDLTSTSPSFQSKPVEPNFTINHPENKESLQFPNKHLKIGKPNIIKTGFKVSGRAKQLTMSEHETVIGLLHMREGIGSPHATKFSNQNLNPPGTPKNKDFKIEQLVQNELNFDVNSFLQNFVHKK